MKRLILLTLLLPSLARGDVYQIGYDGSDVYDTYLYVSGPSVLKYENFGTQTSFQVREAGPADKMIGIMDIDCHDFITAYGIDAIDSLTLFLVAQELISDADSTVRIQERFSGATADMEVEFGSCVYPTQGMVYNYKECLDASESDCDCGATATAWDGSAGCNTDGTDYTSTDELAWDPPDGADSVWLDISTIGLASLADSDTLKLRFDYDYTTGIGKTACQVQIPSSENTTAKFRPRLYIHYTVATGARRLKMLKGMN